MMNPNENPLECEVCGEQEPTIIHTVHKNGVYRGRCTDCLLKEHRELFCPLCLTLTAPTDQRITCHKCTSTAHVSCLRPSPTPFSLPPLAHTFTCPPCTDPYFTFFPRSYVNLDQTDISDYSAKALVVASQIAADILKHAAAKLKEESLKKIIVAKEAKRKAKAALENLRLVLSQKTPPN